MCVCVCVCVSCDCDTRKSAYVLMEVGEEMPRRGTDHR